MKQLTTQGIVLARTNYGEADRILTFLTPDSGKIKAIAKSVRKEKSKLAGGVELFSITDLTVIVGRGEINTLISSRLVKHYGNIVKDIQRTDMAYRFIKQTSRATEDAAESGYFELLNSALQSLNDTNLELELTSLWFDLHLLKLSGHAPNLKTDISGNKLTEGTTYNFHLDRMRFAPKQSKQGDYTDKHIKFLRLGLAAAKPQTLGRVEEAQKLAAQTQPMVQTMLRSFIRT